MTKRYKLLKDTPMDKCDTVFIKCKNLSGPDYYKPEEVDNKFTTDKGRIFLACIVESSPDWFQEIKEPKRIKITRMYDLNNAYQPQRVRTGFETSAPIPNDKFAAVKQAIENVLNEDGKTTIVDMRKNINLPIYTQYQMDAAMGRAYYAGKYGPEDKTFQDYLSSLKK